MEVKDKIKKNICKHLWKILRQPTIHNPTAFYCQNCLEIKYIKE